MEYVEELLTKADFSAEAGLKERLWERISARAAVSVRDITYEELEEKTGMKPVIKESKRKHLAPSKERELGAERTSGDPEVPQAKRQDLVVKKPDVRGLGF
jgi:hypothetical protein